jgi:hypothetical protein
MSKECIQFLGATLYLYLGATLAYVKEATFREIKAKVLQII